LLVDNTAEYSDPRSLISIYKIYYILWGQFNAGDDSPYVTRITNYEQVRDDLDQCEVSASKLWNVGRYYIQERWDDDGKIPGEGELKSELKDHERYGTVYIREISRQKDGEPVTMAVKSVSTW